MLLLRGIIILAWVILIAASSTSYICVNWCSGPRIRTLNWLLFPSGYFSMLSLGLAPLPQGVCQRPVAVLVSALIKRDGEVRSVTESFIPRHFISNYSLRGIKCRGIHLRLQNTSWKKPRTNAGIFPPYVATRNIMINILKVFEGSILHLRSSCP